jgi:pyrimidine operon attenuation protein/uracil phosphoribosyltransferase
MPDARKQLIADADDVERLYDEMALQLAPKISDDTLLLGLRRRGVPIAEALAARLEPKPTVGELSLKRYGDDLSLLHDIPHIDEDSLTVDVRDRHVVIVDDVLYTGESLLRAAWFLRAAGAVRIQVAVLAERAGRTMPVAADVIGCRLEVMPDWVIHCLIPPYEDQLGIEVVHADEVH